MSLASALYAFYFNYIMVYIMSITLCLYFHYYQPLDPFSIYFTKLYTTYILYTIYQYLHIFIIYLFLRTLFLFEYITPNPIWAHKLQYNLYVSLKGQQSDNQQQNYLYCASNLLQYK